MKKQCKYTIEGHVQGVGFRYFVYSRARELNLMGYVKNLYNGNVEVVAEGDEFVHDEFLKHIKTGPSRSHVDFVQVEKTDFTGIYAKFEII